MIEPVRIFYQFTSAEAVILAQIASLADPNADRILFWDDSAGAYAYLTVGSGLSISGTTLTATGSGTGDVVGPASSTDNALAVFDGTTGKLLENSTVQLTATVLSPVTSDNVALGSGTLMWSDLFLASGGVVNFNNGDVLITHSSNTLAFTGASSGYTHDALVSSSVAGNAAKFTNTTDAAANQALILESDRATPAASDNVYASFNLSDSAGNQDEFARLSAFGTTVTSTTEDGEFRFSMMVNGTLTSKYRMGGTAFHPVANDGAALGTATLAFSDLSLASGAQIRIANTDWVATHTTGILTVGTGDLRVTTAGTNSASVVTVGGTQTLTSKTLTSPVINAGTIGTSLVPTSDDGAALGSTSNKFSDLFLASGGVINFNSGDVTVTHSANALAFAGASSGYSFDAVIIPASNDGAALGNTTNQFSDLFLAEGGVINWDNGDVTLTQANNVLTLAGAEFTFGANTAYFTETDNGNSGTSDTIDWKLSNKQKSTLTGNCTFTFTAPSGPCSLILKLVQDGTGSRTVTWPAAVHWSGGTAPTLTTTASRVDIICFYYDGTTYFGTSSLNFVA